MNASAPVSQGQPPVLSYASPQTRLVVLQWLIGCELALQLPHRLVLIYEFWDGLQENILHHSSATLLVWIGAMIAFQSVLIVASLTGITAIALYLRGTVALRGVLILVAWMFFLERGLEILVIFMPVLGRYIYEYYALVVGYPSFSNHLAAGVAQGFPFLLLIVNLRPRAATQPPNPKAMQWITACACMVVAFPQFLPWILDAPAMWNDRWYAIAQESAFMEHFFSLPAKLLAGVASLVAGICALVAMLSMVFLRRQYKNELLICAACLGGFAFWNLGVDLFREVSGIQLLSGPASMTVKGIAEWVRTAANALALFAIWAVFASSVFIWSKRMPSRPPEPSNA